MAVPGDGRPCRRDHAPEPLHLRFPRRHRRCRGGRSRPCLDALLAGGRTRAPGRVGAGADRTSRPRLRRACPLATLSLAAAARKGRHRHARSQPFPPDEQRSRPLMGRLSRSIAIPRSDARCTLKPTACILLRLATSAPAGRARESPLTESEGQVACRTGPSRHFRQTMPARRASCLRARQICNSARDLTNPSAQTACRLAGSRSM